MELPYARRPERRMRAIWYTRRMDTALIVLGLFLLGVLGMWAYARLSDPKEIDQEEEAQARAETPAQREREIFEERVEDAKRNAEDIAMYSPGEESSD